MLALYIVVLAAVQLVPERPLLDADLSLDLAAHALLYLVLGLLVAWAFGGRLDAVLFGALAVGLILEGANALLPDRGLDVRAVVGNAMGALAATGVVSVWQFRLRPNEEQA